MPESLGAGKREISEHQATVVTTYFFSQETGIPHHDYAPPGHSPSPANQGGFSQRYIVFALPSEFFSSGSNSGGKLAITGDTTVQGISPSPDYVSLSLTSRSDGPLAESASEPAGLSSPPLYQPDWYLAASPAENSSSDRTLVNSRNANDSYARAFSDYDFETLGVVSQRKVRAAQSGTDSLRTPGLANEQEDEFLTDLSEESGDELQVSENPLESELRAVDRVLASLHRYDNAIVAPEGQSSRIEQASATRNAAATEDPLQAQTGGVPRVLPEVDTQGGMVLLNANYDGGWNPDWLTAVANDRIQTLVTSKALPNREVSVGTYQAIDVGGSTTELPTEKSTAAANSPSAKGPRSVPAAAAPPGPNS